MNLIMKRYLTLDIAKAICIVLVVIGHYAPADSPEWYDAMRKVIYTFHMPLFMFASGFVYIATMKPQQKYMDFIWKKVKRLMLPYLTTSAIVITIKLLTQNAAYVENPVNWLSYFRMFYLPEAGYFLWFIWALWWMFVITPFFRNRQARLSLFLFALLLHFLPLSFPEVFCMREFKRMFVYFMLGVICFDWKYMLESLKRIPTSCIFMLFVAVEILNLFKIQGGVLTIVNIIVPYIGIAAMLYSSRYIQMHSSEKSLDKWLILSSSSYIIYLFHTTFEGFAKAIVFRIGLIYDGSNGLEFTLGALFVITVGTLCPIFLYRYLLSRYQWTRFLFGLK